MGSTSLLQGPHASVDSLFIVQVVVPSLQSPWSRSLRRPVQQAAVIPATGQMQPGRFLSSGQAGVPPGGGGGTPPPSQVIGGGSFA